MLTVTAVSLVLYLAAAFLPDGSTRYAVFETIEECRSAVSGARAAGVFVTDCVAVELPAPKK